jgi:hypothetical protein
VIKLEHENMALNENVEAENDIAVTPTEEQEAAGDFEEVTAESEDEVETEPEETEKESKKGFSNRVRELNARAKEAEEKAKSLAEKLAEMTGPNTDGGYEQPFIDDSPLVQPGEEIDAVELDRRLRQREARILQRADSLVQLRSKQQEAIGRINKEADEVMKLYPELDPDNENFNQELSDAITEATEAFVLKNPYSASVKSFVGKMMRPYKGAVSRGVGEAAENIAKQVSATALRPTAIRRQEKPAAEKSIAELEAELGVVQA